MKEFATALLILGALTGCGRQSVAPTDSRPPETLKTIDTVEPRPAALNPPPMLTDEGPAPKPKGDIMSPDAPPPPTPQDDALRASLPFAPAIALDPVNGSKISIRANTPFLEYKNRIYYFAGEETKRAFQSSPDQYMKGVFAHN